MDHHVKITIVKTDNGWIVDWWEQDDNRMPFHRVEVFDNADTFLTRIGHLTGALDKRDFLEVFHYREDSGQIALTVEAGSPDALVEALLPAHSKPGED